MYMCVAILSGDTKCLHSIMSDSLLSGEDVTKENCLNFVFSNVLHRNHGAL